MTTGWYYLHTNGALIYKRDDDYVVADMRESDFVRMFWPIDVQNRENAWTILVEASVLGADPERIAELAETWHCDDEDAKHYAERMGIKLGKDGADWCATKQDFVDLQISPAGFGKTALVAMSELCRVLGFHASKMWGPTFKDLLQQGVAK